MDTIIIVGVLVIIGAGLWAKNNRKVKSVTPKVSIDTPPAAATESVGSTEQSDVKI
jgi:hypothetical protein